MGITPFRQDLSFFVELAYISIFHVPWQAVVLIKNKVYTPKIGPKGQMTLPKELRKILGLEDGDRILLRIDPSGKIILEKALITSATKYKLE
ncbi:MAG TPA: AbrB/MazE/SpoVT family DNA-binding domain-containing protein [Clostridia bacterium]|nr:AbrB/MazE/SpoVT family DNA-binding domain-containing protein [Clostridia bacterium]